MQFGWQPDRSAMGWLVKTRRQMLPSTPKAGFAGIFG
jgi:hypothetical protein